MADRNSRSPGARSRRRWRRRRSEGLILTPVELWQHEVSALVQLGLLRPDEIRDREAVAGAIGALLDEAIPRALAAAGAHAPRGAL